jgi:mRNA-degrading endonuclease toxin of MazEF toxin-antitoxin module
MERGEIYRVNFGKAAGREQADERPAIVMQSGPPYDKIPTVLMVPATSKQHWLAYDQVFSVMPTTANGLGDCSVILVHQVRAVDVARIGERLGVMEPVHMDAIRTRLRRLLSL